MKKRLLFNALFLLFAIFCFLYYLGMGIFVRFSQSLLWIWPLAGGICLLRYFTVRRYLLDGIPCSIPRWFLICFHAGIFLAIILILFVEGLILHSCSQKAPAGLDTVIVLGAKVNGTEPSRALRQRIDAAAAYLSANPDTMCIASGGQGEDEGISEAECIRQSLIMRGIAEDRILLEDCSVSTESNLINSFSLLNESQNQIGIVSSDFHICRSVGMARHLSSRYFYGIPARSSGSGFLHYSIREVFALSVSYLRGDLAPAS